MVEVTYFSQFQGNSDGPYAFFSALCYSTVVYQCDICRNSWVLYQNLFADGKFREFPIILGKQNSLPPSKQFVTCIFSQVHALIILKPYVFRDFSLLLSCIWDLHFWNLRGVGRQCVNFVSDSVSVPLCRAKQSKKTPRALENRSTGFPETSMRTTNERRANLQNSEDLIHCLWNPTLR